MNKNAHVSSRRMWCVISSYLIPETRLILSNAFFLPSLLQKKVFFQVTCLQYRRQLLVVAVCVVVIIRYPQQAAQAACGSTLLRAQRGVRRGGPGAPRDPARERREEARRGGAVDDDRGHGPVCRRARQRVGGSGGGGWVLGDGGDAVWPCGRVGTRSGGVDLELARAGLRQRGFSHKGHDRGAVRCGLAASGRAGGCLAGGVDERQRRRRRALHAGALLLQGGLVLLLLRARAGRRPRGRGVVRRLGRGAPAHLVGNVGGRLLLGAVVVGRAAGRHDGLERAHGAAVAARAAAEAPLPRRARVGLVVGRDSLQRRPALVVMVVLRSL